MGQLVVAKLQTNYRNEHAPLSKDQAAAVQRSTSYRDGQALLSMGQLVVAKLEPQFRNEHAPLYKVPSCSGAAFDEFSRWTSVLADGAARSIEALGHHFAMSLRRCSRAKL